MLSADTFERKVLYQRKDPQERLQKLEKLAENLGLKKVEEPNGNWHYDIYINSEE